MQSTADGAIIGQQGVRYGLQRQGKASKAPAATLRPSAFAADDSEEDIEAQVAREAEKKRSAKKVQQAYEQALSEDPNAFEYDGVYDSIQAARTQPRQQEKLARQSKYIAQLKDQAEQRKREEDIRYERRLLKERVTEDSLYEGKEKFVTSAYRKKLEDDKKWLEQQTLKDLDDERQDVRKIGHLGNFYSNLLTKNVAMGAAVQQSTQQEADGLQKLSSSKPTPASGVILDKYEQLRLEAEQARQAPSQPKLEEDQTSQPPNEQAPSTMAQAGDVDTEASRAEHTSQEILAAATLGKRRNDEQAVLSAKERYLARKRPAAL